MLTLQEFTYIGLFSILLWSKHTRLASCVFLFAYAVQLTLSQLLPPSMYFSISGGVHACIFLALINSKKRTYVLVSFISVALVLVNIQGYFNYERRLPNDMYITAYYALLTIQLALLYLRWLINGIIDSFNYKRDLVQFIIDSNLESFDEFIQSEKKETK